MLSLGVSGPKTSPPTTGPDGKAAPVPLLSGLSRRRLLCVLSSLHSPRSGVFDTMEVKIEIAEVVDSTKEITTDSILEAID